MFDRNRASAANNIPHMFQLGYRYEFPFGARQKVGHHRGEPALSSGDWQFNGVFSAYQGRQYTLSASGAALNMPGNAQTPDQVKADVGRFWARSATTAPGSIPPRLRGPPASGSARSAGTRCADPAW